MMLSALEPLLVEAQLLLGSLGVVALAYTPIFRSQGLGVGQVLQIAREGWTIPLALVALNAAGICLASFSSLAGVRAQAEVVEFLAIGVLLGPALLRRGSNGAGMISDNKERICVGMLVLSLALRAIFASLAADWSFVFVLASIAYSVIAALHVYAIGWASTQLKTRSNYLAGASSMRSLSNVSILFGLNSVLLAVILLPFALLAQHFRHAIDPWNTLAPIFIKSSETVSVHASLIDRDTLMDALLRLCASAAFFVFAEVVDGKEAYVALSAITSIRFVFGASHSALSLLAYSAAAAAALVYLHSAYAGRRSVRLSDSISRQMANDSGLRHAQAFALGDEEDTVQNSENVTLKDGMNGGMNGFASKVFDDIDEGYKPNRLFTAVVAGLALLCLCIDCVIGAYADPTTFDWSNVDTRGNTKWIVVTTISLPTSTMEALCALPDWEVAVVADKKTPKQWQSGHCHFLSVQDQMRLPFQIVRHIPFKAYTRKNIGYLYAIANGAEQIFDTDDDNLPTEEIVLEDVDAQGLMAYRGDLETRETVNVYTHFGRPDIWPRGYPLDHIDSRETLSYLDSRTAPPSLNGRALIQQGLADLDPDVDAIFRLLHPQDITTVKFCRAAPSLKLARGVVSPWNSQNTLWHRDAMWGLLLPITVTFRVTDIMRGFWTTRILWDIGGLLSFRRPSVDQIRNVHNYLVDFESELQLYLEAGDITRFLHTWTSSSKDLPSRIEHLFKDMVSAGFIMRGDQQLLKAWLADLKLIGYEFPPLDLWSRSDALRDAKASLALPEPESVEAFRSQCSATKSSEVNTGQ